MSKMSTVEKQARCPHNHTSKEVICGMKTGDKVCNDCGEAFWPGEEIRPVTGRYSPVRRLIGTPGWCTLGHGIMIPIRRGLSIRIPISEKLMRRRVCIGIFIVTRTRRCISTPMGTSL